MITRQHTKEASYGASVELDFYLAQKYWLSNKTSIGNGSYKYICIATTKKTLPCKNKPLQQSNYCKVHYTQ